MTQIDEAEKEINKIIDDLQGICSQHGLSNGADEERIITTIFLYKFLNDKFMYNLKKFGVEKQGYNENDAISKMFESENLKALKAFYATYAGNVIFHKEDTIEYLINFMEADEFYKLFDSALVRISSYPENDMFNITTADSTKKPIFEKITEGVEDSGKADFSRSVFKAISSAKFEFGDIYENNFDFYSRIFEHLIKNYNVAKGTYAEYFTPQSVSKIIAKILVSMSDKIEESEIYDPSAGSGSLILHLANELGDEEGLSNAIVYTQDISNKSSRFLRINLLLNGMSDSLPHVIQGDTLLNPAHYNKENDKTSGLKTFDYIVSNPPFNMDFSSTRDLIDSAWSDTSRIVDGKPLKRFFAGIPSVPNKDKKSMRIFLLFIQHIIYSLNDNGKAAIVVPTGFLTYSKRSDSIAYDIRKYIIDNKILKGVISMPPNIFANTGTNVSVLFLDKANRDGNVMLIDASKLGEKRNDGENQRTFLTDEEIQLIEDTFICQNVVKDISALTTCEKIAEKDYSFAASNYFVVSVEYKELTDNEFKEKISQSLSSLNKYLEENQKYKTDIENQLNKIVFSSKNGEKD